MTVRQVEELTKGRITVHLDSGISFTVYRREVRHLELEENVEVDEEEYRRIRDEILIPRAKKRAMHLLEKMDRTEFQLREKLRQNYYQDEVIDAAVAYVKGFHYVDDLRYAGSYIRYRRVSKSRRQLTMELMKKGVSRADIDQALRSEYGEDDENVGILRWIEKKHYNAQEADRKEKQKMYQFLLRRGFRSEDILKKI